MADVRGLPATGALLLGRFTAKVGPPAGFTAGKTYWPLALGIDCLPVPPVIYALVPDDNGTIQSVQTAVFSWALAPGGPSP